MVMWAQRPNLIFLTVCLEDCPNPEIKLESDKLIFKGIGGPDKKPHELTINFFKDVDTEVCFKENFFFSIAMTINNLFSSWTEIKVCSETKGH